MIVSYYTAALAPSTADVAGFGTVALGTNGIGAVALGTNGLGEGDGLGAVYAVAATASMAASAYHGYKRNDSVGWALWWGLMGGMFPVITPVIAVAQGFGQRAK